MNPDVEHVRVLANAPLIFVKSTITDIFELVEYHAEQVIYYHFNCGLYSRFPNSSHKLVLALFSSKILHDEERIFDIYDAITLLGEYITYIFD